MTPPKLTDVMTVEIALAVERMRLEERYTFPGTSLDIFKRLPADADRPFRWIKEHGFGVDLVDAASAVLGRDIDPFADDDG